MTKQGKIKLPAVEVDVYCDTCGHPLFSFISYGGNGEANQGNSWILSVVPCLSCKKRGRKNVGI